MKLNWFVMLTLQVILGYGVMCSETHYIGITIYNDTPRDLILTRPELIWGKLQFTGFFEFNSILNR